MMMMKLTKSVRNRPEAVAEAIVLESWSAGNKKEDAAMYNFSNSHYQWSHGKNPRGFGNWAFEIGDKIWFATGTLAEAKKKVSVVLKAEGIPAGTTVYVAP